MIKLARNEIVGLLAAIIPFFGFIGITETIRVNGVVTNYTYLNFLAVLGGIVAVKAALQGTTNFLTVDQRNDKAIRFGLFLLVAALGIVQVLRGFGMFV